MKKTPIDESVLNIIRLAQTELPVLTEQDVDSIFNLLQSDDVDIKLTGIYMINTFNYFSTPETVMYLFQCTNFDNISDPDDTFPNIIRMLYLDSDRFKYSSSEACKNHDLTLKRYAGTLYK